MILQLARAILEFERLQLSNTRRNIQEAVYVCVLRRILKSFQPCQWRVRNYVTFVINNQLIANRLLNSSTTTDRKRSVRSSFKIQTAQLIFTSHSSEGGFLIQHRNRRNYAQFLRDSPLIFKQIVRIESATRDHDLRDFPSSGMRTSCFIIYK